MSAFTEAALIESAERLFRDIATTIHGEASGTFDETAFSAAWLRVEDAGIPLLLVAEEAGGVGGSWRDVQAVLHRVGFHSLPLPIGETVLVYGVLAREGIELPGGCATYATSNDGSLTMKSGSGEARFSGELQGVPWGRAARHVLIESTPSNAPARCLLVAQEDISSIEPGKSIAGEPRDTLRLLDAPVRILSIAPMSLFVLGALIRAAQIAGALEGVLGLCVRHVSQRAQFGRPLAQFQAIQQQLAVLAEETAASSCAAVAAAAALDAGDAGFEIAAAKLRVNLAIGRATAIAHQCHGAIGVTLEHALQRSTRRLWSWRTEFGNDRYWAQWLGAQAQSSGERGLWSVLTKRSDRSSG